MKYARNVHFQVKSGKTDEFRTMFTNEILPLLRKQKGFRDEVTLMESNRGMGISLWDDRASAEEYHRTAYPQVLKKLEPFIEGTPRVETFQVAATTLTA